MNLGELQNILGIEDMGAGSMEPATSSGGASVTSINSRKPTRPSAASAGPVAEVPVTAVDESNGAKNFDDKIREIELAQKLGYFLCKCSWPPQIMVMTSSDFVYKCPSCCRVRDI